MNIKEAAASKGLLNPWTNPPKAKCAIITKPKERNVSVIRKAMIFLPLYRNESKMKPRVGKYVDRMWMARVLMHRMLSGAIVKKEAR